MDIYLFTGKYYIYPRTCTTYLSLEAICIGKGCGNADSPRVFHRAETMCKGLSGHQFILGEHSANLRVMREKAAREILLANVNAHHLNQHPFRRRNRRGP
jgi:hypothetical protein